MSILYNSPELTKIIIDWWVSKRFPLSAHLEWKENFLKGKKTHTEYAIKRDKLKIKLIPLKKLLWNNVSIDTIIENYERDTNKQ